MKCVWILSVLIVALLSVTSKASDIRCFCNLSYCVRTGYMCKSSGSRAACYSEYLGPNLSPESTRHGCVELLPIHMQQICVAQAINNREEEETEDGSHPRRGGQGQRLGLSLTNQRFPALSCCQNDMCNYVGKLDINIDLEEGSTSKDQNQSQSASEDSLSSQSAYAWPDLWWFKVAVIAVPIGGSIILVLLILLAVKLLRQDTKRQRNLVELRKQRNPVKPDLLLTTSSACSPSEPNMSPVLTNDANSKYRGADVWPRDPSRPSRDNVNINLTKSEEVHSNLPYKFTPGAGINSLTHYQRPMNAPAYSLLLSWNKPDKCVSGQSKDQTLV